MEVERFLHMNKGKGEASYATNCLIQREIIARSESIMTKVVVESLSNCIGPNMGIADLGCSSGPNTTMVVFQIIHILKKESQRRGIKLPELVVYLNDLPGNDFNNIMVSLPEFYVKLEKEIGIEKNGCFVSTVGGTFYGRLFPSISMHFVHSSSSLHWLSQVPKGLETKAEGSVNKGKIYVSKTSPRCVVEAYLNQFRYDFTTFLRSRGEEMVADGRMLLSFMGRTSPDPAARVGSHQWELLSEALMSMALKGIIEEEKIDALNVPYYAPSPEEVRNVIEEEGSFSMNDLNAMEIHWDEGNSTSSPSEISRGQHVAKTIRAVVEPMLGSTFGLHIMDELFMKYAQLVDHYFSTTPNVYHINLVISLTRNKND